MIQLLYIEVIQHILPIIPSLTSFSKGKKCKLEKDEAQRS